MHRLFPAILPDQKGHVAEAFVVDPHPTRRTVLLGALIGTTGMPRRCVAVAPPVAREATAWTRRITRMGFASPGEVGLLAAMGAEVMHTNLVWPYFPLRRDGGGLAVSDADALRKLVRTCHGKGMKLVLGLPPFMSVGLVRKHPGWRIHRDDKGTILHIAPVEKDLGTRSGCNVGPWGDYLIDVCAELAADFDLDGFSFDGNYHPPLCFCPACKKAYRADTRRDLPRTANLADIAYRQYLVWRGDRLVQHHEKLNERLAKARPGTVVMTWTVNAGRYGHLLHSPRAMPVRLNRLIEVPMQEWWLDETNAGASIAPSFGAAYLRAVSGDRPCASEPYLMSRGNPYGTDSFPHHERLVRTLLAVTHGNIAAHSIGWPGHRDSTRDVFREVQRRAPWLVGTRTLPWLALLVGEQTRQFHAHADIANRFLPHVLGAFRCAVEEHLPVALITDDDVTATGLARHRVLVLPGSTALSDRQVEAIRRWVKAGGGLVATAEASLCNELGVPRKDFALADLFGVSYRGQPAQAAKRPKLDENFAVAIDERYWKERLGVARLQVAEHEWWRDPLLRRLVPGKSVVFRGPLTVVSEPPQGELAWRMTPEGWTRAPLPGAVCRRVGKGRVVYLATALDAALWSYAYPYQRRLLARAIEWAAGGPPPVRAIAPLCVQARHFTQGEDRLIVHLFNGVVTTAHHGLPAMDVPLREETIPIHDIRVIFTANLPRRCRLEPEGQELEVRRQGTTASVVVPRLDIHAMVVAQR
jgi:hypothetical protein